MHHRWMGPVTFVGLRRLLRNSPLSTHQRGAFTTQPLLLKSKYWWSAILFLFCCMVGASTLWALRSTFADWHGSTIFRAHPLTICAWQIFGTFLSYHFGDVFTMKGYSTFTIWNIIFFTLVSPHPQIKELLPCKILWSNFQINFFKYSHYSYSSFHGSGLFTCLLEYAANSFKERPKKKKYLIRALVITVYQLSLSDIFSISLASLKAKSHGPNPPNQRWRRSDQYSLTSLIVLIPLYNLCRRTPQVFACQIIHHLSHGPEFHHFVFNRGAKLHLWFKSVD